MAARSPELEEAFPQLASDNYRLASPVDGNYNCIAYAADDTSIWWWPTEKPTAGYYWPPDAPREVTIEAFQIAFETLGYSVCNHGRLEPGVEKVALFVNRYEVPTHAARQLLTGVWVSKLGFDVDIEHTDPEAVGGDDGDGYGRVAFFMARPIGAETTK